MRQNGLRSQLPISKRVKHGGMSAQITAPARSDSREHGDGITVHPSPRHEIGHKTESGTYGAEGRDQEGNQMWIAESEQELENEINFLSKEGKDSHALIGRAGILARR